MCHLCNLGVRLLSLPDLHVGDELIFEGGGSTVKVQLLKEIRNRPYETPTFKVVECNGARVDVIWSIMGTYVSKPAPAGSEHTPDKFVPGAIGVGEDGAVAYLFYLADAVDPHAPQARSLQVEQITYPWYGKPATLKQE